MKKAILFCVGQKTFFIFWRQKNKYENKVNPFEKCHFILCWSEKKHFFLELLNTNICYLQTTILIYMIRDAACVVIYVDGYGHSEGRIVHSLRASFPESRLWIVCPATNGPGRGDVLPVQTRVRTSVLNEEDVRCDLKAPALFVSLGSEMSVCGIPIEILASSYLVAWIQDSKTTVPFQLFCQSHLYRPPLDQTLRALAEIIESRKALRLPATGPGLDFKPIFAIMQAWSRH